MGVNYALPACERDDAVVVARPIVTRHGPRIHLVARGADGETSRGYYLTGAEIEAAGYDLRYLILEV